MKKAAVVLNWIMLGLFGTALLVMGIQYPDVPIGGSLLSLLPYATALLAFRPEARRVVIGFGLALNGLLLLVSFAYGLIGVFMGQPAMTLLVWAILLPALLLNCVVLKWAWDRSRVKTAADPNFEQKTL